MKQRKVAERPDIAEILERHSDDCVLKHLRKLNEEKAESLWEKSYFRNAFIVQAIEKTTALAKAEKAKPAEEELELPAIGFNELLPIVGINHGGGK